MKKKRTLTREQARHRGRELQLLITMTRKLMARVKRRKEKAALAKRAKIASRKSALARRKRAGRPKTRRKKST